MNQTTPSGQQRLTYDYWMMLTSGYDYDIQREKAGGPAGGGATWTDRWGRIFDALSNGSLERADLYMNYIVTHRRAAGLPDLPDKFIGLIPDPPANPPPLPGWMTHPPRAYGCGHPGELTCAEAARKR